MTGRWTVYARLFEAGQASKDETILYRGPSLEHAAFSFLETFAAEVKLEREWTDRGRFMTTTYFRDITGKFTRHERDWSTK